MDVTEAELDTLLIESEEDNRLSVPNRLYCTGH